MRMAQYRARNQRLIFHLPPLDNLYAVHSALNQLTEAAAAGMIDLKQARYLLSVVRAAGQFLLHANKWNANPYHSDQPVDVDLAKEYGLPSGIDLDADPESVFPVTSVILSAGGAPSAPPESKDPFVSAQCSGQPTPPLPLSGGYCCDHHSHECDCVRIRSDYPMTPERMELLEIQRTQGSDAAIARYKQQQRSQYRRYVNTDRKRYTAMALEQNMRLAAERLAEQKLSATSKKPAASVDSDGAPIEEKSTA